MKKKYIALGFVSSFAIALTIFLSTLIPVFHKQEDIDLLEQDQRILGDPVLVSDVTVNANESVYAENDFSVVVDCRLDQPIRGYELNVVFNASLLSVDQVTEGDIFNGYNTYFYSGTIDNINGSIENIYGVILGDGNVSDPGDLITISFTPKNINGSAYINLEEVGLTNETDYININVVNDTIFVIDSPEAYIYNTWDYKGPGFGKTSGSAKFVNDTYFWKKFKKHSAWQLQAWHPVQEIWVSEWQGTNLNEWLNITKIRSRYNNFEKVTLNVTNNHPTQDLYFRFIFGIDLRVKQYVNKSSNYEYEIIYPINAYENYTVYFNFSDVKPLIQNGRVIPKHGIREKNGKDYFYFMLTQNKSRNPLKAGNSFELDPTFGNTNAEPNWFNMNDIICVQGGTPASSGTVDNISAYLYTGNVDSLVKGCLYEYNTYMDMGNVLIETEEQNINFGWSSSWVTLDFESSYTVNSGTTYGVAIWSDNSTMRPLWDSNAENCYASHTYDGSYPDPLTGETDADRNFSLYCSYTEVTETWQNATIGINGTYSNTTAWRSVDSDINGTYSNTTAWRSVDSDINGTYSNTTAWRSVDSDINGTYSNTTAWRSVDSDINGTYSNTTAWRSVDSDINGTYSNSTIFRSVDSEINGTYSNTTGFRNVDSDINGTYSNDTIWNNVDDQINGTYSNTSILIWRNVDSEINGTYSNVSTLWNNVDSDINGSYSNTSIPSAIIIITNVFPGNNSINIPLQPYVFGTFNNTNGYKMTIRWYNDSDLLGTETNINNGTYNELFLDATDKSTDYVLWIRVNDTTGNWLNVSYDFKTEGNIGFMISSDNSYIAIALGCGFLAALIVVLMFRRKRKGGETS